MQWSRERAQPSSASGSSGLGLPITRGRIAAIASRRGPRLYLAALAAGATLAAFAPLADHLGYELAEWIALLAGLFGGSVGVAASRHELERQARGLPVSAARALCAGLALSIAALAVPVVLLLLNGLRRPLCEPLSGLVLYAALPVPSALLAAALGNACGFLFRRRAALWVAVAFTASLAAALWPLLRGPQVFVFHHLGGMYPGPLYDEAVSTSSALWAFRGCTLLYAMACAGLAIAAGAARLQPTAESLQPAHGAPQPGGPSPAQTGLARERRAGHAILALAGAAAVILSLHAEDLHWQASAAQVSAALGGELSTAHLLLHVPREKPEAERRLLAIDAEASYREVSDFLGLAATPPRGKIEVWLYRSAEEKRRFIGAAETSFTKPWLGQIHTNDAPAPHPILRHELAHALGAAIAQGPFGVPGRLHGLLPDMAFIEGIAVAADWPAGEATVHEEAAAIRRLGKAPDLERLFSPGLFYAESGPLAYTAAGSFLRFLWQERGAEALRRAYASPRGLAELGSLAGSSAAWGHFLDQVQVAPHVQALSALRFSAKPIVRKACAHEVAQRSREAAQAAQQGDFAQAALLLRTCTDLEPDDPGLLLDLRRALVQAHQDGAASAASERALSHPRLSLPQRARLLTELGDEGWARGEVAGADRRYAEAAKLAQPEAAERALIARRYALLDRARWPAARKLLTEGDAGPETLLALDALTAARPREGFAPYLLAKQLQNRGAWESCARFSQLALERELPNPLFAQEALRMRGISAWHLGDGAAALAAFRQLLLGATPGRALEAARWLDRVPPP